MLDWSEKNGSKSAVDQAQRGNVHPLRPWTQVSPFVVPSSADLAAPVEALLLRGLCPAGNVAGEGRPGSNSSIYRLTRARLAGWSVRRFPAPCALREMICAALRAALEGASRLVGGRGRLDLSCEFAAVDGPPGRDRDHRDRTDSRVRRPSWHSPDVAALGAGPRVFPRLPRKPHAHELPRRCRVKRRRVYVVSANLREFIDTEDKAA